MRNKYQEIARLYEETASKITSTPENWMSFLRSACRNYKCSFYEQVLIYAQRPDATAILELDQWNGRFGRWINKGAASIVIPEINEHSNGSMRIRHYFDISDTRETKNSRPVPLWTMDNHYESSVINGLNGMFGPLSDTSALDQSIIQASNNITADNLSIYIDNLTDSRENSYLEELDDLNLKVTLRNILQGSIAYMTLSRCGISPDDYFDAVDFQAVLNFNTPETAEALGEAVSTTAEYELREISDAILKLERAKQKQSQKVVGNSVTWYNENNNLERGNDDGKDNIHERGGLLHPQFKNSENSGGESGEIRPTSDDVSEKRKTNEIQKSVHIGEITVSSTGNRPAGDGSVGSVNVTDGEGTGRNRGTESIRPDEMDRADEQHPALSGGDNPPGAYLQLSMFPSANEQITTITSEGNAEEKESSAFSMSQEVLDHALRSGGNELDSTLKICAWYKKHKNADENITFLKNEYGTGGKGFVIDDRKVSMWFDASGIRLSHGETALRSVSSTLLTWNVVDARISELLESGMYMPQNKLDEVDQYEIKKLAEDTWYLHQDYNSDSGIDFFLDHELFKDGFPESTKRISELISSRVERENIIEELSAFSDEYNKNPSIIRFRFHDPSKLLQRYMDAQIEPLTFVAAKDFTVSYEMFITQDEIDNLLTRGSLFEDGHYRIYSYFLNNHTAKEKAEFLKNEYGIGGSGHLGVNENHNYKGISFKRKYDRDLSVTAEIFLKWTKVSKLIDTLVSENRYMSPDGIRGIPVYERSNMAATVYNFYTRQPEDVLRPFPYGSDYHTANDTIILQLNNSKHVQSIIDGMAQVLENTAYFDKHYDSMKEAYENLVSYSEGTFTLFNNIDKGYVSIDDDLGDVIINHLLSPESMIDLDRLIAAGEGNSAIGAYLDNIVAHDIDVITLETGEVADLSITSAGISVDIPMDKYDANITVSWHEILNTIRILSYRDWTVESPEIAKNLTAHEEPKKPANDVIREISGDITENTSLDDLDFDRVAKTVLERVMQDADYVQDLTNAQSRAKLRNPCTWALEQSIRDYEQDEPAVYNKYFSDFDWREQLFDYVLKESYANRSQQKHAQSPEHEYQDTATETQPQDATIHPEPVFFVDWDTAQHDFDLRLYNDRDVIGYNKDGVEYTVGRSGSLPYVTGTGAFWGDNTVPGNIHNQINAYRNGDLTDEQVRDNYLKVISPQTEPSKAPAAERLFMEVSPSGNERTDYYLFWYPDGIDASAVLSHETLALIKEKADNYIICAEACYLSASNMEQWNIGFRKMPRDWNLLPEAVQEKIRAVRPEYEKQWQELSHLTEPSTAAEPLPSPVPDASPEAPTVLTPPEAQNRHGNMPISYVYPEIPLSERTNYVITNDELGHGGAKTKFQNNIKAIETLQTLDTKRRLATSEEQEALTQYVGWGGLPQAFDENNTKWADEYVQLKGLLSNEEYTSARATTLNAHYTSPTVIKAMYLTVENMGFRSGNILDPGCGTGNFQGLLPESMKDSKVIGIEIDPITGRIAQQLYQKNSILIKGFEKTNLPDCFFDLAIGNIPFGAYSVYDRRYDKHKFLIHDYFIAKTLDKVRPGGIVAFVTSKGTLDKENPSVRKYIAQRAELMGAIRLPNNAFYANAGTQVTTDILFLQKRDRIIDIDPDWVHLGLTENGVPVNSYFSEYPEMVLGTMTFDHSMYGSRKDTTCSPIPDSNLEELLNKAIMNISGEYREYEILEAEESQLETIPADPNVRNFSYTVVDEQIYFRKDSVMIPQDLSKTAAKRVKGMIEIRDSVRSLIEYQTEDYSDGSIEDEQRRLGELYDKYTSAYGLLNSYGNKLAFNNDSSYSLLCSLEVIDDEGEFVRKADMFSKRTIRSHIAVTSVDTASEALVVSIAEKARVDLPYMEELSSKPQEAIIEELQGVIFRVPNSDYYVTSDEYLSGDVRAKLLIAQEAAKTQQDIAVNIAALQKVQPKDLSASEISVRLGSMWVPVDVVQQFMYELLNTPAYIKMNLKVHYSHHTNTWNISHKSYDDNNIKANTTYGTRRATAYRLIEDTLNLKDIRIFDTVVEDDKEKRVLNKKDTAIAQSKQEAIKSKFVEWIWKDPERRQRLTAIYNEQYNSIRPCEYDGSHIRFAGINPEITLKEHQVNAIAHTLYGGNTLLAHVVGAGKTYEMVAAAMESKRLGLCNKSLVVVPNHITEQFAAEWLQLYPAANILVAKKKDFQTKNRKNFCARISTGDYDAVIIGHSQFERIPMSAERQERILSQQIDDIEMGIAETKRSDGDNFTIKQMERLRKSLQTKLDSLNDRSKKDDVVTFEELGVDRLFVDEAHCFKNLFMATKMRNVGGVAQTEAQKSSDLFMKCQYLDEITGGRGVIFATGTPISNSMVELYTMQRYLQYDTLVGNGLQNFDSWASTFGETVNAIELAPEGTGYRAKTRFAKFYNLPELMAMFKEVADIQTADMLDLPVPKANYHTEIVKPSDIQREMVDELANRAEAVRNRSVDSSVDNMLLITNDGRKLALDQRLLNGLLPAAKNGKIDTCAGNVYDLWEKYKTERLTQLVFSDLSTPKKDGTFNVYDELKNILISKGVPAEEIAFIHDSKTDEQKAKLFAKVRSGTVRVLMGSTQKMGAGTNVQDRLIALHDLECPWRPADLEQRLGRIVRQGNKNAEVEIYRYVTEGTFDSYLYQLVENKQRFISQIMTSKSPARTAEDVDETALSYAEIKALATGNPLIIEKSNLEMDVGRLSLLQSTYLSQHYDLEDLILIKYPKDIKSYEGRIAGYEKDIETRQLHTLPSPAEFSPMVISENTYTAKKDAGKALISACKEIKDTEPVPIGSYRGFDMELSFDTFSKEYILSLKGNLTHRVKLGSDIHGNITRINNTLDGFEEILKHNREKLDETILQLERAREEVDRPFPQSKELKEKTARLNEVNVLLNMDEKDNSVLASAGESLGSDQESYDLNDTQHQQTNNFLDYLWNGSDMSL